MENKKKDNTLQEILEEDNAAIKKKGKRKGCFFRFLLILTLLFIFFYGFLYVVQYLTDLEAEARVNAILTAGAPTSSEPVSVEETAEPEDDVVEDSVPTETVEVVTATPDADLARTATIAAQLTSVAEFQATETPAD
jgi:hypothetical protein